MPGANIPSRNAERRRRNKEGIADELEVDGVVEKLSYDPAWGWHDVARDWFDSLRSSGQSDFYEPSDWQTARLVGEQISRELNDKIVGIAPQGSVITRKAPIPGASLTALSKLMSVLMVTEGDRRRYRLEVQRQDALNLGQPGDVVDMDAWRSRALGGSGSPTP